MLEGYFGDPMYGGNKDMGSWKMMGYPGVRADYQDWVTKPGPYPYGPVSLHGKTLKDRFMSETKKPVDAVIVGFGWTGAIMAAELCERG